MHKTFARILLVQCVKALKPHRQLIAFYKREASVGILTLAAASRSDLKIMLPSLRGGVSFRDWIITAVTEAVVKDKVETQARTVPALPLVDTNVALKQSVPIFTKLLYNIRHGAQWLQFCFFW